MGGKTLGLIHTSASLVPVFAQLCQEKLPGIATLNIADDSLIKEVIARGELTTSVTRRVVGHVESAEAAGADFVLVTCSSIGAAVEIAAKTSAIPVMRVDLPMADEAVCRGRRIAVLATLATTLAPTADLIERRAAAANREVEICPRLCHGAFDELMKGDAAAHDAAVAAALDEIANDADVVVLAQASMARVVEAVTGRSREIPILTSPSIAVGYLAPVLGVRPS